MPPLERYLKLFEWYGLDAEDFYRRDDIEEKTAALFEQLGGLMMADNAFNRSLPWQFLQGFRGYHEGDASALALFNDSDRRAVFLSDFYDYLQLKKRGIV